MYGYFFWLFRLWRTLKKITSTSLSNLVQTQGNSKTIKLIVIMSLLALIRDLPIGLLTVIFVLILTLPACLTNFRLLMKELTIIMSSMNFFVLYYTNSRFKETVLRFNLISNRDATFELEERNETNSSKTVHDTR